MQVIVPIGWMAGHPAEELDALRLLYLEMLGHRADLEEQARHTYQRGETEANYKAAALLERYAASLAVILYQLDPSQDFAGLRELAAKHGLQGLS